MASMKHVWLLTVFGIVGGAALLGTFVATSGGDLERGAWDDLGRGVWVMLTDRGRSEWWSWIIGGVVGGVVCFAIGRTSYRTRQWRESQAARAATVAHPMD